MMEQIKYGKTEAEPTLRDVLEQTSVALVCEREIQSSFTLMLFQTCMSYFLVFHTFFSPIIWKSMWP